MLKLNSNFRLRKGFAQIIFFIALSLAAGNALAQASDEYLKSLQGEAETVTLDEQTQVRPNDSVISGVSSEGGGAGELVDGLSIEQFESVLQKNYIGSYLFYKRLSDNQKKEVFTSYQENPSPDSVRNIILKVSKQ